MNVLLDTCARFVLADGPLPARAAKAFGDAPLAFVSPVSAWEAAIKHKLGKITLGKAPAEWFEQMIRHHHCSQLPLSTALLCAAADLPLIHSDPFDRVLVATALAHRLTILTSDSKIAAYPGIRTFW